jgi:hypothetical protein
MNGPQVKGHRRYPVGVQEVNPVSGSQSGDFLKARSNEPGGVPTSPPSPIWWRRIVRWLVKTLRTSR